MLNIFVCEDNPFHKAAITRYIQNYITIENLDTKLILSTSDPYEIIGYLAEHQSCGLYFLDVDLRCDIDGIVLAKKIREYDPRGFIVFITTHAEALQLTFKYYVEAMDYILKEELSDINMRICQCIKNALEKYSARLTELQKTFSFKTIDKKIIIVEYKKILYFEVSSTSSHKIMVYTDTKMSEFYSRLSDLEKSLGSSFYRCHKSFIVNTERVSSIDEREKVVYLNNGSCCFVSSRNIAALKKMVSH